MRRPEPPRVDPTLALTPDQRRRYEAKRLVAWDIYQAATNASALLHWTKAEPAAAAARSAYTAACGEAYREVVHGLAPSALTKAA